MPAAFYWSEAEQSYFYAQSGRRVPQRLLDRALDRAINSATNDLRALTERLQAGSITLADWQAQMAAQIKLLHTGAAAFGRGGWQQMSPSDWGWTGQRLRTQYGYLRNFAQDVAMGKQPLDGRVVARAAMYAQAARSTQRAMQRRMAQGIGMVQERNQLGAADRHCSQCVDIASRGWVPIGSLPPIGSRICRSMCKCTMIYRDMTDTLAA